MKFINPFDIAELVKFNNLTLTNFKKFKKRLQAEMELNEGIINIKSIIIQQSDIYEVLDLIDRDKEILNIYKSLYRNKHLNNYLFLNGGTLNASNIKNIKNIISLEDKQIIKFITPYLINIFSKIFKEAFLKKNIDVLYVKLPIETIYIEKIYEPIYKILKNKEDEIISLKDGAYDLYKIKEVIDDIEAINSLPEYFIKIRSDISYSIRNLSIDSWNENKDLELSLKLIDLSLSFKLNNKIRSKILSDKNDLIEIKKQKEELPLQILKELNIEGIDNLTYEQLNYELENGANFRQFEYCVSFITLTSTKISPILFIKHNENYFIKGSKYFFVSLLFGWWGVPWGPVYTIISVFKFLFGGRNLTKEINKVIASYE